MSNYTLTGHTCAACGTLDNITALDLRETAWRDPHGFYYCYRCETCGAQFWNTGSRSIRLHAEQEYHPKEQT